MLFKGLWRHLKRAFSVNVSSCQLQKNNLDAHANLNECAATGDVIVEDNTNNLIDDNESPSLAKRLRIEAETDKPEAERSSNIAQLLALRQLLTCNVCFDVAKQANQCANGHLICLSCSSRLEQVSFSTDEAKAPCACPVCRVSLCNSGDGSNPGCGMQRCLLAEKLAAELPVRCRYCETYFPRKIIELHQRILCGLRLVKCKFAWLGCEWRGFAQDLAEHSAECTVLGQKTGDVIGEVYQQMHDITSTASIRLQPWRGLLQILEDRQKIRFGRRFNAGLRLTLLPISLEKTPNEGNDTRFKSPLVCMPMIGKHSLWVQVQLDIVQTESTSNSTANPCEALYNIEMRRATIRPNMTRSNIETSLTTNHVFFSIMSLRSESINGCEEDLDLMDSWHRYSMESSTMLNASTGTSKVPMNSYRLAPIPENEFDHVLRQGCCERVPVELLTSRDSLHAVLALAMDPSLFTTAKKQLNSWRETQNSPAVVVGGSNRRERFHSSSDESTEATEEEEHDGDDDDDDETVTYLLAEDILTSRRRTTPMDATGVISGPDVAEGPPAPNG